MKFKSMNQRLYDWFRKFWLPSIIRSAAKDTQAQNRIEAARIMYRVDRLTKVINELIPSAQRINSYTFVTQPELRRIINSFNGATFSQYREDLLVTRLFEVIGIDRPSYIDIGAHHPRRLSNTALMNMNGSSGINVEANPLLFKEFEVERPEDINVNCGIGASEGEMLFYVCADATLSTFSQNQAEILKSKNISISATVPITVMRLDRLLEEKWGGVCPNFLSIDIEGMDYAVLETIDYEKHRPDIICVEINTHDKLMRIVEIEFLLFDRGYFHFGDVGGGLEGRNAIFVDMKHAETIDRDFYKAVTAGAA